MTPPWLSWVVEMESGLHPWLPQSLEAPLFLLIMVPFNESPKNPVEQDVEVSLAAGVPH